MSKNTDKSVNADQDAMPVSGSATAMNQKNVSDTSFKGRKPSDKSVGSFGKAFGKDMLENARPEE
jgi:hypothetical protein